MARWLHVAPWLLVVAVLIASSRDPAPEPGSYVDRKGGFSMTLPGFADHDPNKPGIRCMFFAPREDGFAANTNVMIQPGGKTAEEYMEETRKGLEATGFELIEHSERTVSGLPAVTIEYGGTQRGKEMRFLALAVLGEKRVWLMTCSSLDANFEDYRDGFNKSIASFEVLAAAKPTK